MRQIGVALVVSRDAQLPLFYREYEGNRHDSKQFNKILTEMISRMRECCGKDGELTLVFDKGMNSVERLGQVLRKMVCSRPVLSPVRNDVQVLEKFPAVSGHNIHGERPADEFLGVLPEHDSQFLIGQKLS